MRRPATATPGAATVREGALGCRPAKMDEDAATGVGQALPPANLGWLVPALAGGSACPTSSTERAIRPHNRRRESGFALLLVFLMAAIGAIMLYNEIPRVAFETQRQKEQMLIERGQQYKRAIQLFLRASNNQRWPASLDELESFNGKRFLRRRYKDPMTGKDEWRLVHIQNGFLTDSVNNKPAKPGDQKDSSKDQAAAAAQSSIGDYGSSIGNYAATQSGGALNAAQRRRASDTGVPGAGTSGNPQFPGVPGTDPNAAGQAAIPPVPGVTTPGQPALPQGFPGLPGQAVPSGSSASGDLPPGQMPITVPSPAPAPLPTQLPGQTNASNQAGSSQLGGGSTIGDYSSIVATPTAGSQPGGVPGQMGGQPGQYPPGVQGRLGVGSMFGGGLQPSGNAGQQPGMPGTSSMATNLINNLLTSPRPGGLAGITGQNTTVGGGIAGVASTEDGDSIMVYNTHTNYSEWEFIFDPTKQHYPPPNPLGGGAGGTPASQMGSIGGSTPGTPAGQMGSMPGTSFGAPGAPGMPGATGTSGTPGMPGMPGAQGVSPFGSMPSDPDMRAGHP